MSIAVFCARGQSPADWWYFGEEAGMHFTPTGPVADTNGALSTFEGCASISDNDGNLLFYTDGTSVWNANHDVMPNGNGLFGNSSSTQSAIIIPVPNNPDQYYIVTIGTNTTIGLNYSVVDMNLAGGLGDVVVAQKNILIRKGVREKILAIKKEGDANYWLATQVLNSDSLLTFEVGSLGINTTPQVSILSVITPNISGYLKSNIEGSLLVSCHEFGRVQLMEFDNSTGLVTADLYFNSMSGFSSSGYGAEFSPNSEFLYTAPRSSSGTLFQYNVSVFDSAQVAGSQTIVADSVRSGALQLGPDGKIYMATTFAEYVSCIQDPNEQGLSCNFLDSALLLAGRLSTQGLPPFIANFFNPSFETNSFCFQDSTFFSIGNTEGIDSVFWNFGDPASGAQNTSILFSPAHFFTDTGSFDVTLIAFSDTLVDTVIQSVFIYPRQTLNLGSDTALCSGDTLVLNIAQAFSSYLWYDGSTADSFLVTSDDQVSVTLFGVCDTVSDTIGVRFDLPVVLDLGLDTTFCVGSSIVLDGDVSVEANYEWNTGDTTDQLVVSRSGRYIFTAENGCGTFIDSIDVTVIPRPDSVLLPPDTVNCFDAQIILERPINDSITYVWSDSSSVLRFEVDSSQSVWLAASSACGFTVDTINILFNGELTTELGEDTTICDKDSILLQATDSLASFFWNTGDTSDSIYTTPEIDQNYVVTITKGECVKVESRRVDVSEDVCPSINCALDYGNIFTPNGDGVNDVFRITSDCDVFSFDMIIYNRWGQMVNYTRNLSYGWDGSINGEPASEGTYYFVVFFKDLVVVDADRQVTRGSFTLKR